MKLMLRNSFLRFNVAFIALISSVIISTLTRVALLIYTGSAVELTFGKLAGIFSIGLFYDLVVASFIIIPLVVHLWLQNDRIYEKRFRTIVLSLFLVVIGILVFTQLVPKDFNEDLRKVIIGFVVARCIIWFALSYSTPAFRNKWRVRVLFFDLFLILFLLLLNAASEFFFWQEFSVRYNFIAVDYLIYTTEVIGNIKESYPVTLIFGGIALISLMMVYLLRKPIRRSELVPSNMLSRTPIALSLLLIPFVFGLTVSEKWHHFSKNEYASELAGNGMFQFNYAYWNNELDFFKFYHTLPTDKAFSILRSQLQTPNGKFVSDDVSDIERDIHYDLPEQKKNVVMISVESLSADFMQSFGGKKNITPYLDSLSEKGMLFTNLYASGTRTVRGLEALSLSVPPTPGQSIVKRPSNENLFTLAHVLNGKGYNCDFIYGGYGYFDNMNYFFGNNGYNVVDRTSLKDSDIHYQNIWGVADEDLFTLALRTFDQNAAAGKPFFGQVMTVSNHRPFTYPDGRIDILSSTQSREGAVKYTDYAINKFLKEASTKPWFNNTIFIVVADHCAGSAGSVELPVTGYHIPMIIYSPGFVQPQKVDKLMAQIDVAPTILGLLKMNYRSRFFGSDIFSLPEGRERAFISTYQGLGYLRNGKLIIQSPRKEVKEYRPDFVTGKSIEEKLTDSLAEQAIAYYQCASWLYKNKKL
jgi:phosphoglycerol transferase MdoB-like AlkP superfamily enzyme